MKGFLYGGSFIFVCLNRLDPVYLIVEDLAQGTLKELLTKHVAQTEQAYDNLQSATNTSLTPQILLSLAKGVADGMTFLASRAVSREVVNFQCCVTIGCCFFGLC